MDDKQDIGIVTPCGIWFNGKIYSCALAVKQQWFKYAEQIGGWPVPVLYEEGRSDQLSVLLQDGTPIVCFRIDHIQVNVAKLKSYYLEFQRLVELRKQLLDEEETLTKDQINSDKPTNY